MGRIKVEAESRARAGACRREGRNGREQTREARLVSVEGRSRESVIRIATDLWSTQSHYRPNPGFAPGPNHCFAVWLGWSGLVLRGELVYC